MARSLLGLHGATRVLGPQKGASELDMPLETLMPDAARLLETAAKRLSEKSGG
jgi:glycerate kinase